MPKQKTTETFIKEASQIHSFKYTYTDTAYINDNTPVVITCPIHGNFEQTPRYHLRGGECPICTKGSQLTTDTFVKKALEVHSNKFNYSKTTYVNSKTKVTITCPIHGDFEQSPAEHLAGKGCKRCAGITCTEDFVFEAIKVHGDKYDYSNSTFVNFKTPIKIVCKEHGEFSQIARYHVNKKHGCPTCAKSGFNNTKPGTLYYLSVLNGTAYKIGITNKSVNNRFDPCDLNKIKVLRTWYFDDGLECYNQEQRILKEYVSSKYTGTPLLSSGNTELFSTDVLNLDINLP